MPEFIEHKCGIGGVSDLKGMDDVMPEVEALAKRLVHRGGKATGAAFVRNRLLHCFKENGTPEEVFARARAAGDIQGTGGIFNDRYITNGGEEAEAAQPILYGPNKLAIVFNGNLRNYAALKSALFGRGRSLSVDVDTDALGTLLWESIYVHRRTPKEAFEDLDVIVDGAYNLVTLESDGRMCAYRDPNGFHPLFMARVNGRVITASEDQAIRDVYGNVPTTEIEPGMMVEYTPASRIELQQVVDPRQSACFFEAAYFADVGSTICKTPVHRARYEWGRAIGRLLKEQDRVPKKAIVTPVPHSAKAAASGLSDELDFPRVDAIRRNIQARGYTKPTHKERQKMAKKKYSVVARDVRDRIVMLVDDSVVRGTTLKTQLINELRDAGVKEIHLCLASPPFFHDCHYGINIRQHELIAPRHSDGVFKESGVLPKKDLKGIARELGVDRVTYLPVSALATVLGVNDQHLCTECVTGRRPPMNSMIIQDHTPTSPPPPCS